MLTSQLLSRRWNHFISNWRALGDQPARNNVFIFPLFFLPLPTLFQFLIGFLNRSNRLGEMSLWLMWLWWMTSTNAGRLKHFAASSLLHSVLTSRGSFPAPDWSHHKGSDLSLIKTLLFSGTNLWPTSRKSLFWLICHLRLKQICGQYESQCGWSSNKSLFMKDMSLVFFFFFLATLIPMYQPRVRCWVKNQIFLTETKMMSMFTLILRFLVEMLIPDQCGSHAFHWASD